MSIDFKKLLRRKEGFLVDDTASVYVDGGVLSANDMACFGAWFEISNPSGGLGGAPGTVTLEYTPDDGTTWVTVPGMIGGSITGAGSDFNLQASASTGVFPPVVRFKFVAPAGQSYRVVHIRRNYVTPGLTASLRSTSSTVSGFGVVTNASRVASMLGSIDVAPTPSTTGYQYVTSTGFTKSVAGDGRALDVNIASAVSLTSAMQINYNGSATTPTYSTATPTNNKGVPVIFTAGDALAPVAMGSGADSVLTLRTTLSTRHETVGTPLSNRLSDGTNWLGGFDNVAVSQFSPGAGYKLPTASIISGWNGAAHQELLLDSGGRTLLSTRHEAVATPLMFRPSDGTNALSWTTSTLNTQYTDAATTYRVPVSSYVSAWDGVSNVRREVICDTLGNQYVINKFSYNGTATVPVYDNGTPANNIGTPYVQLSGQGAAPVAMGTGADGATVPRVTLSTRHENVATPIAAKLSDGTNSIGSFTNVLVGAQYTSPGGYRMPVTGVMVAWNGTAHKEVKSNASDVLQVEQTNVPTSMLQGNALIPVAYDYIGMNYAGATADVYTYKTGGAGGATVATLTVNYVDATKAVITSVVRT